MSIGSLDQLCAERLADLDAKAMRKGVERVVVGLRPAEGGLGERYLLRGFGERGFLCMNANSYLALNRDAEVIAAEARAAEQFGSGPGAVRFISGTYAPHQELEAALARFHGREAAMITSAAYSAMVGVLPQLLSDATLVVSDALNHNCIINAIRLAAQAEKAVYPHCDMAELERLLEAGRGRARRVCVVTDGVFSMRGDHAPLDRIAELCRRYEGEYPEGVFSVVDDSHGVGALGATGRGTEEQTGARADVLIATLGKALGVNGGYVVASATVVDYLRETTPTYVYSNPITPAEAAAAVRALAILDSEEGASRLARLRALGGRLRAGLRDLGRETLAGDHPIVPLLLRDTALTRAMVEHLFANDILVTGLSYPVVPRGEEEIRLQVSAGHTERDMAQLLDAIARFGG